MICRMCNRLHYTADRMSNYICVHCRGDGRYPHARCPDCGRRYYSWEYLGDGYYDHVCPDEDEDY